MRWLRRWLRHRANGHGVDSGTIGEASAEAEAKLRAVRRQTEQYKLLAPMMSRLRREAPDEFARRISDAFGPR